MNFQFSHPVWLLLLPVAWAAVLWLAWKTDVQTALWRRWVATGIRLLVVSLLVLAVAGIQWLRPQQGVNVFFLLDRSDSIPSPQQEAARKYVNRTTAEKKKTDRSGILVFGAEAALETETDENPDLSISNIMAVVGGERTDISSAIRLGTAAFPETGQKRLVLVSDGNENMGDALTALQTARRFGVSMDVMAVGVQRANDVSVQKLVVPGRVKEKQTFEAKIFVHSDQPQSAVVRLYRNDQPMGEDRVQLGTGKNLFTFPQTLTEPGFYSYTVFVEAAGDRIPQNNRASSFTTVRGNPRVLIVSAEPNPDRQLASTLQSAGLEVKLVDITGFPQQLGEMQSYDAIFLSNVAAGDLGEESMKLLESAVKDFGVGLVCIGGDQSYAAGGYRGTPLEATLPVSMELDSKKVLPSGAIALVMHGMEFANGNQVARDCAIGVLDALGPQDELGVVLWDGSDRWLFPMTKVGDKKELGRKIAGMNQGDLPSFQNVMTLAYQGLKASTAHLKHMIIFSDGDPGAPSPALMQAIVGDRVTVSTVLIAGHAGPETMKWIADNGRGRFYDISNPSQLPQIFIKETAVILKSAIFEEPFKPTQVSGSELLGGIGSAEYPTLRGYVCTSTKPRAETPLLSDKGDPVLAHWHYGLGRAVAFTSDAKAKWASDWLGWAKYKQFWTQVGQWALRRVENADFTTEVSVDQGRGQIAVEAVDEKGNYRNFLDLQVSIVSPKGEQQSVRLEQTGPGHYEGQFPTKQVGSYLLNLMEIKDGKLVGSQVVGASVNYSPEFNDPQPNLALLKRLAEVGEGQFFDLSQATGENPFLHDRKKTFQPRDLWEWLLKCAVIMFTLDVGVRRIQLDRDEVLKALAWVREQLFFWRGRARPAESDESLAALLARRDQVRQDQTPAVTPNPDLFRPTTPVTLPAPTASASVQPEETAPAETPTTPAAPPQKPEPASVASRLLEAKRRAQRKKP